MRLGERYNPPYSLIQIIMTRSTTLLVLMSLSLTFSARGQMGDSDQINKLDNMNGMDHGPFASTTISTDPLSTSSIMVYKGIAVKVGDDDSEATMVFDTDLMRVAGAWTGGFLHWYEARTNLQEFPSPAGFPHFNTSQGPGWTRTGQFNDPRRWPYGPMPDGWVQYKGLYVHGDHVVFSYSLGRSELLELFGFARVQGHPIFTRTFDLNQSADPLSLRILQAPGGSTTTLEKKDVSPSRGYVEIRVGDAIRQVGFQGLPEAAKWRIENHHLILDLPPFQPPVKFELSIGPVMADSDLDIMSAHLQQRPAEVRNLKDLIEPGPSRWELLETEAVVGSNEGPFVVDELTLPDPNPWNSYLRMAGVDFLSDGRAAVASLSGDVWLVSGIGETLNTLGWKRFATGLNQPLGLKIVDDQIYVTGRDQITRLHDRNGDGEADFYESFNNEVMAATNFHAFTMNLETDSEGNFYFTKATPWPPHERGEGPPRAAEITPHHGVLF